MLLSLFKILNTGEVTLSPDDFKIHFACSNGKEDPLLFYLKGNFDTYQNYQTRRNFERKYVLSLIRMTTSHRWLFVGVYESFGCSPIPGTTHFQYDLKRLRGYEELEGRVVVHFNKLSRQSYRLAEDCIDQLEIEEILPKKFSVNSFDSYHTTKLTFEELALITQSSEPTWRTALSTAKGIYLIMDRCSGLLYVGKADGANGFWGRWTSYAVTGHGGNRELVNLLEAKGDEYRNHFLYSILEIADTNAGSEFIDQRESHWKEVLGSRAFGLNAN